MVALPASIMPRVRLFASRSEWLAARTDTIGASEVPMILGLYPKTDRGEWYVYDRKRKAEEIDEDDEDDDPNEPRVRGHLFEPVIRQALSMELGATVEAPGVPFAQPDLPVTIRHRLFPWLCVSPDGFVDEPGAPPSELKTDRTRGYAWGPSGLEVPTLLDTDGALVTKPPVPVHHWIQVQTQLEVQDTAEHGYLCVLLGSFEFRWYRLLRDRAFGRWMCNRLHAWRKRHLVEGVEPDPDASEACIQAYRARYLGRAEGDRVATADEAPLLRTYGVAAATEATAADVKNAVRARVIEIIGSARSVRLDTGERIDRKANGTLTPRGFLAPAALRQVLRRARPESLAPAPVVAESRDDEGPIDFAMSDATPDKRAS